MIKISWYVKIVIYHLIVGSLSVEFEKLKKKKYLNCYSCKSYNVDKLNGTSLINKSKDEKK